MTLSSMTTIWTARIGRLNAHCKKGKLRTEKQKKKRSGDGVTNTEYLLLRKIKDHVGRENAIPGDELARYLGLASTRDVRLLVEGMRKLDHSPIMSLPNVGYWWPKEWGENESHCINHLRDMGKKFFWNAEGVEKGLLDLYGDPKMF
jgi:hypothetical protein